MPAAFGRPVVELGFASPGLILFGLGALPRLMPGDQFQVSLSFDERTRGPVTSHERCRHYGLAVHPRRPLGQAARLEGGPKLVFRGLHLADGARTAGGPRTALVVPPRGLVGGVERRLRSFGPGERLFRRDQRLRPLVARVRPQVVQPLQLVRRPAHVFQANTPKLAGTARRGECCDTQSTRAAPTRRSLVE